MAVTVFLWEINDWFSVWDIYLSFKKIRFHIELQYLFHTIQSCEMTHPISHVFSSLSLAVCAREFSFACSPYITHLVPSSKRCFLTSTIRVTLSIAFGSIVYSVLPPASSARYHLWNATMRLLILLVLTTISVAFACSCRQRSAKEVFCSSEWGESRSQIQCNR